MRAAFWGWMIGAVGLVPLTGCDWVASFESAAHEPPDATISADRGLTDAGRLVDAASDGPLLDGALRDGSSGGEQAFSLPDGSTGSDLGAADGPTRADARGVNDSAPPDAPSTDTRPPTGPCAQGTVGWEHASGEMALCNISSAVTQCDAPAVCNGGADWSLCTSTQYATFFASGPPPAEAQTAWLGTCVREAGGSIQLLLDSSAACAHCEAPNTTPSSLPYWPCGGGVRSVMAFQSVGVVSGPECRRLGINSLFNDGFWSAWPAHWFLPRALCCKNQP